MSRYIHFRCFLVATIMVFGFGVLVGYVFADDSRIEKEQEQLVRISRVVQAHYARRCAK